MGYLGRRIGLSQDNGNSNPGAAGGSVGGGILDLFTNEYFQRQGNIFNHPGVFSPGITATGGVINDYSAGNSVYRAHTFTSSGTFDITSLSNNPLLSNDVDCLIVAGGGGGGYVPSTYSRGAGGGGAGGFREIAGHAVSVTSYAITIGAGGLSYVTNPTVTAVNGFNGSDSVALTYTSTGGGGGATFVNSYPAGSDGGSGGGGFGYNTTAGGATIAVTTPSPWPGPSVQGHAGGAGAPLDSPAGRLGGGGGGAGGAGQGATNPDPGDNPWGNGGSGSSNTYRLGPAGSQLYAGGGGGGAGTGNYRGGLGGPGGGGAGGNPSLYTADPNTTGVSGTESSGGGGGGATGGPGNTPIQKMGGNGGSGIVVIRYKIAKVAGTAKATGGDISFYGDKTIHVFTGSGTFATTSDWSGETVEYVVVGGGGSGGRKKYFGAGGGAGSYRTGTTPIGAHPVSTAIQIGGGGVLDQPSGPAATAAPADGTPSYFGTPITAPGGGGGATYPAMAGRPGGSGGGGAAASAAGGTGTGDTFPGTIGATPANGWGYDGGIGGAAAPTYGGGGGGGAGGIGADGSPTVGGAGGIGIQLPTSFRNPASTLGAPGPTSPSVTGADTSGKYYVAGGGGGSSYIIGDPPNAGAGGFGGGGEGGQRESGVDGIISTGSGGGGNGRTEGPETRLGRGGSGIVIIAYPT